MKRIFLLLLILFVIPTLSCADAERRAASYQQYPMTVVGTLTCDDFSAGVTVNMQDADSAEITVDSPKNLLGYSFKVDNGEIWVYYDNMQVDLAISSDAFAVGCVLDMLSVDSEAHVYSRKQEGIWLDFFKDQNTEITLYTRENEKIPHLIKYSGKADISFEIESLITDKQPTNN